MLSEKIQDLVQFIVNWKTLAGIIAGILIAWLYGFYSNRPSNDLVILEKKMKAYKSIKTILNEMLNTMDSPESVKQVVAGKIKDSVSNGMFATKEDQSIINDVMEAHSKYLAFGDTISKTTYSNKELINDYHNFIYKIIEKIERTSKDLLNS